MKAEVISSFSVVKRNGNIILTQDCDIIIETIIPELKLQGYQTRESCVYQFSNTIILEEYGGFGSLELLTHSQ